MSIFTAYVRALCSKTPPSPDQDREALETLRRLLVHEMRRRGLWNTPPSYLGIVGAGRWQEGDALEELSHDAYLHVFITHLGGLHAQLKVRSDIDGLIRLNVRHFVTERQKVHDPLGYRVYDLLAGALGRAVAEDLVHVFEGGSARIDNETLFGFPPATEPIEADLGSHVVRWLDDGLLIDLVTAQRRRRPTVEKRLAARVRRGARRRHPPSSASAAGEGASCHLALPDSQVPVASTNRGSGVLAGRVPRDPWGRRRLPNTAGGTDR